MFFTNDLVLTNDSASETAGILEHPNARRRGGRISQNRIPAAVNE